ncbi:MAG: hypothetical protein E6P95_03095 [Candidatus Moraniibacteriota bacterium]|nr:MAG: hypothetical protein E6P95_03095 [Candidatus Moranbacteria bacterium]
MIHLSMKFILIAIFLLTVYLIPIKAFAEGNIITVTPQLIQLDLSESPPEAEYFYTNSTSQTIELTLSMQDVKELEDRGVPGILDGPEAKNYKYGLSSWAKFSSSSIVIAPNETKKVTVFIDANRLSIGGHYASVLAEVKQIDKEGPVKLRAILSSLLFVRQGSGHETERAALIDLRPNTSIPEFPTSFNFKLNNMGNIDLTPYGRLTVTDPFGREIATGIVNEDSLVTLPESIRRYTVNLAQKKSFLLPGVYRSQLTVRYGKKRIQTGLTTHFISLGSIPLPLTVAGLGLLAFGGFGLFKFSRRNNAVE